MIGRARLVMWVIASGSLIACTLFKPSDDELRGDTGGTTGGGGKGGNGALGGIFGGGGSAGVTPKCGAPADWTTTDLSGTSTTSGPLLVQRAGLNDIVVAWTEGGDAWLRSLSKTLTPGTAQQVSTSGDVHHVRIAFDPSSEKLGLVWFDSTLKFASVASDGAINKRGVYSDTDPLEPVGKAPTSAEIAPRASGGWGIVWQGNGDYAQRLYALITDPDGQNQTQIGGDNYTRLTDGTCRDKLHPALIAHDGAFALVYADSDGSSCSGDCSGCPSVSQPEIQLEQPGADIVAGLITPVTKDPAYSDFPALARNGTEFGVAWVDERIDGRRVWFARIGATTDTVQLSDTEPNADKPPSIAAHDDAFGVAWQSGASVQFAVVRAGKPEYGLEIASDATNGDTPSVIWADDKWVLAWAKSTVQISTCAP